MRQGTERYPITPANAQSTTRKSFRLSLRACPKVNDWSLVPWLRQNATLVAICSSFYPHRINSEIAVSFNERSHKQPVTDFYFRKRAVVRRLFHFPHQQWQDLLTCFLNFGFFGTPDASLNESGKSFGSCLPHLKKVGSSTFPVERSPCP